MNRDNLIGLGFIVAIVGAAVLTYFGKADPVYSFGSIMGAFLLWVQDRPAFVKKFFGGKDDPPPPAAGAVAAVLLVLCMGASSSQASCSPAFRNAVAKSIVELAPCLLLKVEQDVEAKDAILQCNVPQELVEDALMLVAAQKAAHSHVLASKRDAGACQ